MLRPLLLTLTLLWLQGLKAAETPNLVVIFMDDLGYGDIGCFGAKGYQTPRIDSLAAEGRKFTQFHVAQPVCSASRTALLTGCYPNRLGIHGALGPQSRHGIAEREMTLAELVKQKAYATCAVGKWHLGSRPRFLPTRHGFDRYFGLPYSNDMWPHHPEARKGSFPPLPLLENEKVIDDDVSAEDQRTLTERYTLESLEFIRQHKDKPFLLYLAHSMVHVPLFAGAAFEGKSGKGLFADVMMEIDASVGRILDALDEHGLRDNTWVIFSSDNGPWLSYGEHAGSAGPLREGKGTCWEGGTRVPTLMRWPGKIPAGSQCTEMLMTIDLLPSIASVIDAKLPTHPIDGRNCWPLISGQAQASNPHAYYSFYYEQNELQALTSGDGRWKLQLPHRYRSLPADSPKAKGGIPQKYRSLQITSPQLYDLHADPGESKNLAASHPEIVERMLKQAEEMRADLGDKLSKRPTGRGTRQADQDLP
jgi:arylsulfatase A